MVLINSQQLFYYPQHRMSNHSFQYNVSRGADGPDALVQEISNDKARALIPFTAYVCFLMSVGLIGNSWVFYYYGFKAKKTANSFFIVILAVYDLVACAIVMPADIVRVSMYFTFENTLACKILRCATFFAAYASMFTLVAIASDRFKRVCRVTQSQMNTCQARYISLIIGCVSAIYTVPAVLLCEIIRVPIEHNQTIGLYGHTCSLTKKPEYRTYVWVYIGCQFAACVVVTLTLIIMYSNTVWTLYCHRKRLNMKRKHVPDNVNKRVETVEERKGNDEETTCIDIMKRNKVIARMIERGKIDVNEKSINAKEYPFSSSFTMYEIEGNQIQKYTKHNSRHENETDRAPKAEVYGHALTNKNIPQEDSATFRVTMAMVLVTGLFIASFLPYLSIAAWRAFRGKQESLLLSNNGLIAFNIGHQSHFINNVCNPWIYGIFNSKFRQFYFRWCNRKRH